MYKIIRTIAFVLVLAGLLALGVSGLAKPPVAADSSVKILTPKGDVHMGFGKQVAGPHKLVPLKH